MNDKTKEEVRKIVREELKDISNKVLISFMQDRIKGLLKQ
jgi:hypothetical protein